MTIHHSSQPDTQEIHPALRSLAPSINAGLLMTLVEASPREAAEAASGRLVDKPQWLEEALVVLFGRGDAETAHAIISRCDVKISEGLATSTLNALEHASAVWDTLRSAQPERFGGRELAPSDPRVVFERYLLDSEGLLAVSGVEVCPKNQNKKFMLMDSSVGPFIRVGGPFHRDIVAATIRELVECGRVKAAASLTQRGGGWLTNLGDEIALNGASTDFGPPDYNVVQRILSQELPSVKVSVLE